MPLISVFNENDPDSCRCFSNVALVVSSEYLVSHHPAVDEQARAGDPTRRG